MKKQLLTLACLAACLQVSAKDTKSTIPFIYPYFNIGVNAGGQTPIVNSRLISKVCYIHNGQQLMANDSITYSYSNGRGGEVSSEMTDEFIPFDESVTYLSPNGTQYVPSGKRTQIYDQYNKVSRYFVKIWKPLTATWKDTARYAYYYNTDNKLEEATVDRWGGTVGWYSEDYFGNIYDANNGNLVEVEGHLYKINISYDAQGRVVEHVEKTRTTNTPDYVNDVRTVYEYDNGFAPKTQTIQKWDGANWVFLSKENYTYSSADQLQETVIAAWDNGSWKEVQKLVYSYDVNGNKTRRNRQEMVNNAFADVRKDEWTYNSSNQPLTYDVTTWDAGTAAWEAKDGDTALRFYYEHFDPTSIKNVAKSAELSVYPIPAQTVVNMAVLFDKSQEYDLSLIDMQGRVVYQSHRPAAKVATATVPVSALPSGQYMLYVAGTQQSASKQIIVAK